MENRFGSSPPSRLSPPRNPFRDTTILATRQFSSPPKTFSPPSRLSRSPPSRLSPSPPRRDQNEGGFIPIGSAAATSPNLKTTRSNLTSALAMAEERLEFASEKHLASLRFAEKRIGDLEKMIGGVNGGDSGKVAELRDSLKSKTLEIEDLRITQSAHAKEKNVLESHLSDSQERARALAKDLAFAHQQLESDRSLKALLQTKDETIHELTEKLREFHKDSQSMLNSVHQATETRIKDLTSELLRQLHDERATVEKKDDSIRSLAEQLRVSQESLVDKSNANRSAEARCKELASDLMVAEKRLGDEQHSSRMLLERKDDLLRQLEQKYEEDFMLAKKLEEALKAEVISKNKSLQSCNSEIEELKADAVSQAALKTALEKEVRDVRHAVSFTERALESRAAELQLALERCETLGKRSEKLETEKVVWEREVRDLRSTLDSERADSLEAKSRIHAKILGLEDDLESLRAKVLNAKRSEQMYAKIVEDLKEDCCQANESHSATRVTLESRILRLSQTENLLDEARRDNEDLQRKLRNVESERDRCESTNRALKIDLDAERLAFSDSKSESQRRIVGLEEDLAKSAARIRALDLQVAAAKMEHSDLLSRFSRLGDELQNLQKLSSSSIDFLKKELAESQDKVDTVVREGKKVASSIQHELDLATERATAAEKERDAAISRADVLNLELSAVQMQLANEVANGVEQKSSFSKKARSYEVEILEGETKIMRLSNQCELIKADLAAKSIATENLKAEKNSLDLEVSRLTERLRLRELNFTSDLNTQEKKFTSELDQLKERLSKSEETIRERNLELENCLQSERAWREQGLFLKEAQVEMEDGFKSRLRELEEDFKLARSRNEQLEREYRQKDNESTKKIEMLEVQLKEKIESVNEMSRLLHNCTSSLDEEILANDEARNTLVEKMQLFESEIQLLTGFVAALTSEKDVARSQISQLASDLTVAKDHLEAKERAFFELQGELESARAGTNAAEAALIKSVGELKQTLIDEKTASEVLLHQLAVESTNEKLRADSLMGEIACREAEYDDLQRDFERLDQHFQTEISAAENMVRELSETLETERANARQLQSSFVDEKVKLLARIKELEGDSSSISAEKDALIELIQDLTRRNGILESEIPKLRGDQVLMSDELDHLQRLLDENLVEKKHLETDLAAARRLEGENAALSEKCADLQLELDGSQAKVEALKTAVHNLSMAKAAAESALEDAQLESEKAAEGESTWKGKSITLETELRDLKACLTKLEDKNATLVQESSKKDADIRRADNEISEAKIAIEAFQKQLQENQSVLQATQQEITASKDALQTRLEIVRSLESEISQLQGEKQTLKESLSRYQREKMEAESRVLVASEDLRSKDEAIQSLKREKAEIFSELRSLQNQASDANARLAASSQDKERIQELEKRIQTLTFAVEEEKAADQKEMMSMDLTIVRLKKELEDARTTVETVQLDIAFAEELRQKGTRENESLRMEKSDLETQLGDLKAAVAVLEAEKASTKEQGILNASAISKLEMEKAEAAAANEKLLCEIAAAKEAAESSQQILKGEKSNHEQELSAIKSAAAAAEKEKTIALTETKRLERELDDALSTIISLQKELKEARNDIDVKSNEIVGLKEGSARSVLIEKEKGDLERRVAGLEESLAEAERQNTSARDELRSIESSAANLEKEKGVAEAALKALRVQLADIDSLNAKLKSELEDSNQSIANLQTEKNSTVEEMKSKELRNGDLKAELDAAQAANKTLQEEKAALEEQLQALSDDISGKKIADYEVKLKQKEEEIEVLNDSVAAFQQLLSDRGSTIGLLELQGKQAKKTIENMKTLLDMEREKVTELTNELAEKKATIQQLTKNQE